MRQYRLNQTPVGREPPAGFGIGVLNLRVILPRLEVELIIEKNF
jgi:hypothetical protein